MKSTQFADRSLMSELSGDNSKNTYWWKWKRIDFQVVQADLSVEIYGVSFSSGKAFLISF